MSSCPDDALRRAPWNQFFRRKRLPSIDAGLCSESVEEPNEGDEGADGNAVGGAIGAIPGTQTLESKKDPPLTPQKDRRAKPRVPGQRELLLPITGGQGTPSRDVAEQKARGRVDNAIYDFARGSPDPGGTISRLMLENETAYSEALAAEIRQAGSGWQVLSARHGLAARSA